MRFSFCTRTALRSLRGEAALSVMEEEGAERSSLREGGGEGEKRKKGMKKRKRPYEISTTPEKEDGKSVLMVSL
jgi:hypothetical protein